MAERLPDATLERALRLALEGVRGEHRLRLRKSVLSISRGWRTRRLLISIAGLLFVAAMFVVIVSLFWATSEQAVPTWARIVVGLVLGLGTLGSVLAARPMAVRIDGMRRRVRGRGGDGSFDVQLSSTASMRITRSVANPRTGSGRIELIDKDASWTLLDVEDVSHATLTRLEVLTMALSAWLELPWADASDEATLGALAPSDERVGVAKRGEGMSVGDVVVAALEIIATLG
jgi:hypothetical protein